MKTLQYFKDIFAINYLESNLFRFNLKDPDIWQYFTKNVDNDVVVYALECAAKRYAQYMCEQQRLLCCEQITLGNTVLKLKEQILSTPLVTLKTD